MLFNSIQYLLFLPIVLAVYWLGPKSFRPTALLIASYFYYMSWLPEYGLLLACLTVANYFIGWSIDRFRQHSRRLLIAGLVLNLGTLCFYKYTNLLLKTVADAGGLFGPASDFTRLNIILPLGISFFAFEFIHYLMDVSRGHKPIRNFRDFALFAAFFPSQIAGPIKRYQDFSHQLEEPARFEGERFHEGMALLLQGLFKKVALSDNLAAIVDVGFQHGVVHGTLDTWVAALAFVLQIYFDFSGYTDMGRGSAMLLGFSLPDNFNLPYLAGNLNEFWKRWHISLSTWLRDYLYIPLGGNRCSPLRRKVNLMITMLLGGLWHGADWHYMIWGAFHGIGLVVCNTYDDVVRHVPWLKKLHAHSVGKVLSVLLTFGFIIVADVIFRAPKFEDALVILQQMVVAQPSGPILTQFWQSTLPVSLSIYSLYLVYAAALKAPSRSYLVPIARCQQWLLSSQPLRIAVYAAVFICAVGFNPTKVQPFIYFQF